MKPCVGILTVCSNGRDLSMEGDFRETKDGVFELVR